MESKQGSMLAMEGLISLLVESAAHAGSRVDHVLDQIRAIHGAAEFADDLSVLEVEID